MYISLKALACSTLGTLLFLSILPDVHVADARPLIQTSSKRSIVVAKRDLLSSLIPIPDLTGPPKGADPAPAPAPAPPPSPPPPSAPTKDPEPPSEPAKPSPPKSHDSPGLVEQLLGSDPDPPKHGSPSSSPPQPDPPASTSSTPPITSNTEHKKKPTPTTGNSKTQDDDDGSPSTRGSTSTSSSSGNNGDDPDSATATNGANSNSKNAETSTPPKEGLSSGIVAMIVIVVLAVLAAILLSCYRIRQSRVRRREREPCWDEDILRNHVGAVGYNNGSSGNSIDVKSEALGDGGCTPSAVEAAYAGRGSLGGTSLRDNNTTTTNVYGGTYSPYMQHAHAYPHGHQQQGYGGGGGGYGGSYY